MTKKIFLFMLLIIWSKLLFCQTTKLWSDELRQTLTLNKPLVSDSIFNFNPKNGINSTKTLYINKIRPKYKRAHEILDSIKNNSSDPKDIGRIITICYEYETRYKAEFQFSNDYYLDIYHSTLDRIPFQHKELNILYELENTILFLKYKNLKMDTLIDILKGRNNNIYSKEMYTTELWKQYGGLTMVPFNEIVENRNDEFASRMSEIILNLDLSSDEGCREFFYLFDRIKSDNQICSIINSMNWHLVKSDVIKFLKNVVLPKKKLDCVQKIISEDESK